MTLNELYKKLFNEDSKLTDQEFIDIVEANYDVVQNTISPQTQGELETLTRIIADFGLCLVTREAYLKAIKQIDKAIELFKENEELKNKDLYKVQFFETLVFNKGVAFYYLNQFDKSTSSFKSLLSKFPDNNKYQNWLVASKNHRRQKLSNYLWYPVFVFIIIGEIFDKAQLGKLYNISLTIGIICVISALSISLKVYLDKKKIKNGG